MRKLFFILLLFLGADRLSAQMQPMSLPSGDTDRFSIISDQLLQAMLAGQTDSTRAIKHHGRWETFWKDRVANNALPSESIFSGAVLALDKYMRIPGQCIGNGFAGDWRCMGPFVNYFGKTADHAGRTVSLWVKPADPNYILTGSSAGGLWKTTDGGHNWTNITDNLQGSPVIPGTMGITDIAVSPVDEDIIYIATGNSKGGLSTAFWDGRYGLGIAYSLDGGQTWGMDLNFRSVSGAGVTDGWVSQADIIKLAYNESTGKLYAMAPHKIFMKASQSTAWQDITPSIVTNMPASLSLSDFECTKNPYGKVVFSTLGMNGSHLLFIYDENSQQWSSRTFTFNPNPNPALAVATGIYDMSINGNNDIYMLVQVQTEHDYKVYKTGVALSAPLVLKNNDLLAAANWSHIYIYMRGIEASQVNPDLIYLINTSGYTPFLHKSTDGGQTLTAINCTHADGRAVLLYHGGGNNPNGNDDIIYACEDGGISKKAAGSGARFYSLAGNGLTINQFLSISTNPANDGMAVAGAIDNGNFSYMQHRQEPWLSTLPGGDGMIDVFANNGEPLAFTQFQHYISSRFNFDPNGNVVTSSVSVPAPPDKVTGDYVKWQRPLHFNSVNSARYGRHFIWQRQLYDPYTVDWTSAFGTYLVNMNEPKNWIKPLNDATNKAFMSAYKKPVEFFISEKNPDIAYIAYYNVNWQGNANANDTIGNLYVTRTTPINWTNISPSQVTFGPITDIAVDPAHPSRIWVSYGATNAPEIGTFPQNRTKRVLYSDNYGLNNSWVDVSKGLPPMPIIQLLYVPGSDDILFAATDIGVYRWNKAEGQWECFNDGMPRQIITYLDYIPCSGKLRVSTYGRGIWESPISGTPDNFAPDMTDEISSNTTWNSSKTITGSVRVKSGATLTISGASTKIYMPKNARILVEKNAKLIVDAATITNECQDCLWQGIELAADPNHVSSPAYQGYVNIRNGAHIENAHTGVCNYDKQSPPAVGGGIIIAANSTFRNCSRSVELSFYPNYDYGGNCSFDHVSFLYDNPAVPLDPVGFFTSWNTKGDVKLTYCTFNNSVPLTEMSQIHRSTALYMEATGMLIQHCSFEGFRRGVYDEGYTGTPTRNVRVFQNSFNHITDNVTFAGDNFGNIRGNTFTNMFAYQDVHSIRHGNAIYLDRTTGNYVGCSNSIDGTTNGGEWPTQGRYGIIVNDCGLRPVTINNNSIDNTLVGTQPQGSNLNLSISCNQYADNEFAWLVNPQSTGGALNDQGTGCAAADIRAGNQFISNQKDIYSYLTSSWNYYAGNGTNEIPAWWYGNMSLFQCSAASNCSSRPVMCNDPWDITLQNSAISQYNTLVAAGKKESADAQLLYGHIIRGYNSLGNMSGLRSFLESQNDDRSRKLLIPFYLEQKLYDSIPLVISRISMVEAERTAYVNYYNFLKDFQVYNRRPDSLTTGELSMLRSLAADSLEVSPYARGLLEWGYGDLWDHPIEPLPLDPMSRKVKVPETPGIAESRLMNAVPNPTSAITGIKLFIGKREAMNNPLLVIHDAKGKEVFRQKLNEGENTVEVNTGGWMPGIYLYSLNCNNRVLETKKLSVVK